MRNSRLHLRYWHHKGNCKGTERTVEATFVDKDTNEVVTKTFQGTEIFYPPRIREVYAVLATEAKTFCNGVNARKPCPVRDECLEWAITTNELFGIYGGMSHRERNALVRKRHRKAQEAGLPCETRCIVCEGIEENEDLD